MQTSPNSNAHKPFCKVGAMMEPVLISQWSQVHYFCDKVPLCSPERSEILYIDLTGLTLRDLLASASFFPSVSTFLSLFLPFILLPSFLCFLFVCFWILVFQDRVGRCDPGNPPVPAFLVLEPKARATTTCLKHCILK